MTRCHNRNLAALIYHTAKKLGNKLNFSFSSTKHCLKLVVATCYYFVKLRLWHASNYIFVFVIVVVLPLLELFESFVTSLGFEHVLACLVHGQSDVLDVVAAVGPDSTNDCMLWHADVRDLINVDVQEVANNATQKSLVRYYEIGFVLEAFDADQRVQNPFTAIQIGFS